MNKGLLINANTIINSEVQFIKFKLLNMNWFNNLPGYLSVPAVLLIIVDLSFLTRVPMGV